MAEEPNPDRAILELAKHIYYVTLAFVLILAAAIGLDQLAKYLVRIQLIDVGSLLEWALVLGKYFLLAVDSVLLILLVLKFAWRVGKKF